jgi:hypothetical protein
MSTTTDARYSVTAYGTPADAAEVTTVAIIGAGRVGTALARGLVENGYTVNVVGPGTPEQISLIVEVVAPGARAVTAEEAVAEADVVIVAVPLHKVDSVNAALLDGKVVVDVMNYWEPIDGYIEEFAGSTGGTSPIVAQKFPGARVVKAFNHIGYHDIESDRRPQGADNRRALAVAGDDLHAVSTVMALVDKVGFDPLYAGALTSGTALEAGGEVFGVRLGKEKLGMLLGAQ